MPPQFCRNSLHTQTYNIVNKSTISVAQTYHYPKIGAGFPYTDNLLILLQSPFLCVGLFYNIAPYSTIVLLPISVPTFLSLVISCGYSLFAYAHTYGIDYALYYNND